MSHPGGRAAPDGAARIDRSRVLGRGWFRLTTVMVVLAAVLATGLAALAVVYALAARAVAALDGGAGSPTYDDLDSLAAAEATLQTLVQVAQILAVVVFLTWLYQLRTSDRVAQSAMRHGTGWAIGAWFVPGLNAVRPAQIVNDVWRGLARPPVPPALRASAPAPKVSTWWWSGLLGGFVLSVASDASAPLEPVSASDLVVPFGIQAAAELCLAASAVLWLVLVQRYAARAAAVGPAELWTADETGLGATGPAGDDVPVIEPGPPGH